MRYCATERCLSSYFHSVSSPGSSANPEMTVEKFNCPVPRSRRIRNDLPLFSWLPRRKPKGGVCHECEYRNLVFFGGGNGIHLWNAVNGSVYDNFSCHFNLVMTNNHECIPLSLSCSRGWFFHFSGQMTKRFSPKQPIVRSNERAS